MVLCVLKQNKMIQNRKGRSKAGKDVLKCSIFWQFCPQKCAKVRSHIARPKKGRTHTHPAHFPEWILHAHARRTFATHSLHFGVGRHATFLKNLLSISNFIRWDWVNCPVHILRGPWHRLFHIQVQGKCESRESQSVRKAFMGQIDAERHHFTQGPTL